MPRKFTRVRKKRYWAPETSLKVSIPLNRLPTVPDDESFVSSGQQSLVVSVLRKHFDQLTTIQQLQSRIAREVVSLPDGWVLVPSRSVDFRSLNFCYFQSGDIVPHISFSIDETLQWSLTLRGCSVVSQPLSQKFCSRISKYF